MFRIQKHQTNDPIKYPSNPVDQFKQQLIGYIYNTIDISKYKYELLQLESELGQLLKQKYFVSVNFSGSNCLLVFTKIKDKYHSYLIDRKTLSYNLGKINYENIKLNNTKIKLDPSIYLGTILDGIYITTKEEKLFVITDVYSFKGQDCNSVKLDLKLHTILSYLKTNYDESDAENDIVLSVNKLYDFDKTDHLVNSVIPAMKNISIRGICFYPEMSGTKLIYLFGNEKKQNFVCNEKKPFFVEKQTTLFNNNNNNNNIAGNNNNIGYNTNNNTNANNITTMHHDHSAKIPTKITKQIYVPTKSNKNNLYVFEMKKTQTADVYVLNLVQQETPTNGGKALLKRKKAGIAFIPDTNKSEWCEEIMQNTDTILVSCKYHTDKHKWEPIELSNSKRPNLTSDFDVQFIDD